MTADMIINNVKGRMPARAQVSGMLSTPPPIIVAVILKTAAIKLACRLPEFDEGIKNVTSAIDVALCRNGTNV